MSAFPDLIGIDNYSAMVAKADATIAGVRIRTVLPPLPKPLQTASGQLTHAPVLLIGLETSVGAIGDSYLFSPRADMVKPLAETIRALAALAQGRPCDPAALGDHFDAQFMLFGGTGILTMARAAIDMALWDAVAKLHDLPLYRLLGGDDAPVRAYESSGLGISDAQAVAAEAKAYAARGFQDMKVRLGYPDPADDIRVLEAVRDSVGPDIGLMVDYNQALSYDQALQRCRSLDPLGLLWIEEPLHANDLEGAARLAKQIKTPIQLGENLFSLAEVNRSLALKSGTYLMPDVMKIGGVTPWLIAAHRAALHSVPVSSHLFPEFSAHLLACAPNRHFLEYVNWTDAILQDPVCPENGHIRLSDKPGAGMVWNEAAVEKYRI